MRAFLRPRPRATWLVSACLGFLLFAAGPGRSWGGAIAIPNASFESPVTPFVSVVVESWAKSPKPAWYTESNGFLWDQLAGIFKNTAPGEVDHIVNCDGAQAAWLFAVREVALFQDYDSRDGNDPAPTHAFDARYEVGKSYRLTAGVIGGGGNMLEGVPLGLELYYRNDAGEAVAVASVTVTNNLELFGSRTRFVDFTVRLDEVQPGDAWAGRQVGIALRSLVALEQEEGGFWDVDNVRLEASGRPQWRDPVWREGRFEATLESEPGLALEVLAATDPALPPAAWEHVSTLTNATGTVLFSDPNPGEPFRFFQARQLP